jgi:peptidoglycan/xylan/chitin deacetylase (PgdA/CDA1 family)
MRVSAGALVALTCGLSLLASACRSSNEATPPSPSQSVARTPLPAPEIVLTSHEKGVWAPLPPDRSQIPVLLYHGIGPSSDFSNADDAEYGIAADDFAKQMTMIHHAGYQTIDLETFVRFVEGDHPKLPPRPLLLTFDDARADSWTGADGILSKLHYNAVMFVDVGRVEGGDPEYLRWPELQTMQTSGRWELQLHAGHGHQFIQYGPGANDFGPFYAYQKQGEDFAGWEQRVHSDIEWGQQTLAAHIPEYRPLAFAPPYGSYGQDGTNNPRIPDALLGWLVDRFGMVFTQDVNALARSGATQPLGRIQVTRATTGGVVHEKLLSGEN